MNIAIVGLGYVGLSLAVEFAKKGVNVYGIERKKARVDAVNRGSLTCPRCGSRYLLKGNDFYPVEERV